MRDWNCRQFVADNSSPAFSSLAFSAPPHLHLRLSVRPSQTSIVSKPLNLGLRKQYHHPIEQGLQYFDAKELSEIPKGSLPTRAPNVGGVKQISTPHGSKTPRRILTKPRIYNYVAGTTTHANPCGTATKWVVLANT